MDDCSPEPAALALAPARPISVQRTHLGFIGNVNAGVQAARGDWLVILNNDTVVRLGLWTHWTPTQHDNVGLVGCHFPPTAACRRPGGIVWRDGSAWNWGRGQTATIRASNHVRDADYRSGAAPGNTPRSVSLHWRI